MTKKDSIETISKAARHFFSGTMLSRITGMIRDSSMAAAFGTNSSIAAFMVAFRFAHLLRRLFGEGPMQGVIIPHYEEMKAKNPLLAQDFFAQLCRSLTALLSLIILFSSAAIALYLFFGNPEDGNKEILILSLLLLPSLLFICLFGINMALLQCYNKQMTVSVAPVAFNLIWIFAVWILKDTQAYEAMPLLSIAVIFGCIAQWAVTLPEVLLVCKQAKWKGSFFSKEMTTLVKPWFLGMIGVAAVQINNACDAIFARYADPEGPAALWYALRLQQLPLALFGIAVSGALLPALSRAMKRGDQSQFLHFLQFGIRSTLLFTIPLTVASILFGVDAVALLFGHGRFEERSICETARSFWGYSIGLLPMTLTLFLAPAFYAKGDYKKPSVFSCVSMIVNIGCNYLCIFVMGYGTESVAYSTSFAAWLNMVMLWGSLQKEFGSFTTREMWKKTIAICFATLFATTISFLCSHFLLGNDSFVQVLLGKKLILPDTFTLSLLLLGLPATIFTLIVAFFYQNKRLLQHAPLN